MSHNIALFIKLGGHVDQPTLWQDLWSPGALGLQGHEHLFTSHCAQSTETSQDSCGNTYAHKCAFILAHICAVAHTVVHTCGHKAHTGTCAPHWASTLHTHSLDVHIASMKTTLELTCPVPSHSHSSGDYDTTMRGLGSGPYADESQARRQELHGTSFHIRTPPQVS